MPLVIALLCIAGIGNLKAGFIVKGVAFFVAFLGGVLNFLVVAVNGWRMPVRVSHGWSPEEYPKGLHKCIDNHSRLIFLADIIPIGKHISISIGDVLLVVGILGVYLAMYVA